MKRRKTQSNREVLAVLQSAGHAMSHEMIRANIGSDMDRATIYRVLNRFCEDGKVHRIVGDDGKQYFAVCSDCGEKKQIHTHNHLRFRCFQCGKVECFNRDISVPLPEGYLAMVHNLMVSGLCSECA